MEVVESRKESPRSYAYRLRLTISVTFIRYIMLRSHAIPQELLRCLSSYTVEDSNCGTSSLLGSLTCALGLKIRILCVLIRKQLMISNSMHAGTSYRKRCSQEQQSLEFRMRS